MACTTYISDNEAEELSITDDPQINEQLHLVKKLTGVRWLVQLDASQRTRKIGWFKKEVTTYKYYTLYWPVSGTEYQIINFMTDRYVDWTNGTWVSKEVLLNYLMGFVAGFEHSAKMWVTGD